MPDDLIELVIVPGTLQKSSVKDCACAAPVIIDKQDFLLCKEDLAYDNMMLAAFKVSPVNLPIFKANTLNNSQPLNSPSEKDGKLTPPHFHQRI
jgi:hypothetical protein